MSRCFWICIVILMGCQLKKDKEIKIIKDHYDNGSVSAEYETIDSVRNGKAKLYYPSGQIQFHLVYKNDQLEGEGTEYFPNGKVKKIGNFAHDKLNGMAVVYFENGNIQSRGNFADDLRVGKHVFYYENKNEQIKAINDYRLYNGRSVLNSYIQYDIDGNITEQSPNLKFQELEDILVITLEARIFDKVRAVVGPYDKFLRLEEGSIPDTIQSIDGRTVKIPYTKGDTLTGYIENYEIRAADSTIAKHVWFSYPDIW